NWRRARGTPGSPLSSAWLVGSFSLTGAEMPRHAAETSALLRDAGLSTRFVGYGPRLFCEAHLGQVLRRPENTALLVYLRAVFRPQGLAQGAPIARARAHLWRLWQLWRLLRTPGPVVLIRHPFRLSATSLGEVALASILRAALGRRLRAMGPMPPPARIVSGLTGRWPRPAPTHLAEERCFRQILDARPEGQRISAAHIRRALGLAEVASKRPMKALARDVEACLGEAERITPQAMAAMLAEERLAAGPETSRAIAACLAPAPGEGTRLEAHLRALGRGRVARKEFAMRGDVGPSPHKALLSCLRGSAADDAALRAPLGGDPANLSRGEAITLFAMRARMQSPEAFRQPWRRAAWSARLAEIFPLGHPAAAALPEAQQIVYVHGRASEDTGLSMNMWMSLRALQAAGLPARLSPLDGARNLPTLTAPPRGALSRDVALYHLNADQIPEAAFRAYRYRAPFQIGFLLWELDRVPAAHRLALEMLDEIWVPSVFLQRLYQPAFPGKVILMRKGLSLPHTLPPLPRAWRKRAGITRFIVCFDANSSVVRKNPLAAVRAFQAAFPRSRAVELIVKTTHVEAGHWGDPEGQMGEIAKAAAADPRIRILTAHMPFPGLCQLVASADALISPHRAEGFGYLPAFALAMGRPVIATDYSGTRDFCTADTSYPIPFRLRSVPQRHAILPTEDARWAEIDVDALAHAMAAVAAAPEAAAARGRRGQALMALDYTIEAQAARYRLRLEDLGLLQPVGSTETLQTGDTARRN
ncbi:MAG: glycosyltransferase, partial [Pseudomonadota bacterium]